jgi:hypothetical protein
MNNHNSTDFTRREATTQRRVLKRSQYILRSKRFIAGVVLIATGVAMSASVFFGVYAIDGGPNVLNATLTASSSQSGFGPEGLSDGTNTAPNSEWRATAGKTAQWVNLQWAGATTVSSVVITRSNVASGRINSGALSFSDGSSLLVTFASGQNVATVSMTPRMVTSARFTVVSLVGNATTAAVSELHVLGTSSTPVARDASSGGNAAAAATVTASSVKTGMLASAATDAPSPSSASSNGKSWMSSGQQTGAWVQLAWNEPRELSSLRLVAANGVTSAITKGHVLFNDGSTVPFGGIDKDAVHATTVAFMPRTVTSARFYIDGVTGSGPVGLGEISAYDTGTTPPRFTSTASTTLSTTSAPACNANATAVSNNIIIACPTTNTAVDGSATISLYALGLAKVTASAWGGTFDANAAVVTATPDPTTGFATLTVDAGSLPRGPFVVQLQGFSDPSAGAQPVSGINTYLSLYNTRGSLAASPAPAAASTSGASAGMTLAYDDEFGNPVTTSATGAGADYASGKPTSGGSESFGDALFVDPSAGLGNMQVVDNNYLRITTMPKPANVAPNSQSKFVGGMLSSGHTGGSGFSAQYGYFESRMFVPAGKGTWPAFWVLPSPNLVSPSKVVTEIDTTEIYGENPTGTCSSTHNYEGGVDTKNIQCADKRFPTAHAAMGWHTYGVRVAPTLITFYIDGNVIATAPQVSGGADPMFLMVNLALGGGWPVNLNSVGNSTALYVDYVRAYS